jgi:hypothetical protein
MWTCDSMSSSNKSETFRLHIKFDRLQSELWIEWEYVMTNDSIIVHSPPDYPFSIKKIPLTLTKLISTAVSEVYEAKLVTNRICILMSKLVLTSDDKLNLIRLVIGGSRFRITTNFELSDFMIHTVSCHQSDSCDEIWSRWEMCLSIWEWMLCCFVCFSRFSSFVSGSFCDFLAFYQEFLCRKLKINIEITSDIKRWIVSMNKLWQDEVNCRSIEI